MSVSALVRYFISCGLGVELQANIINLLLRLTNKRLNFDKFIKECGNELAWDYFRIEVIIICMLHFVC